MSLQAAGQIDPTFYDWLTATPLDTAVTREYQRRIDQAVQELSERWDDHAGLWVPPGEPAPFPAEALITWSAQERRAVSRRAEWHWYYRQGRQSAAAIGKMAFCYKSPLSRYFCDPGLLRRLVVGLTAFGDHQIESGEFVFCPIRYADVYGPHEQGWRLEPLIYALTWLRDDLPPDVWSASHAMIQRGVELLRKKRRPGEVNNRGAVWCAVMALAGRFFGEPAYMQEAADKWNQVRAILAADGQLLEGIGPDSNYSFTGMSYVYLYRLFSGDTSLDGPIERTLQWFAKWHSPSGYAFEGMSCRKRIPIHTGLGDLLAPFERYANAEPFYLTLRDRYLERLEALGMGARGTHGCSMYIWAMLEHQHRAAAHATPAWFHSFTEEYTTDVITYALIKRSYQTCVTLRAPMALKGLQTWAYGDEPPLVLPGSALASRVRAWGVDSAALNVSVPQGSAGGMQRQWDHGDAAVLSLEQELLCTDFLFTPFSTLVLYRYGGPNPRLETTWICDTTQGPSPTVTGGVVLRPGLAGRLYFPAARSDCNLRPVAREHRDEGRTAITWATEGANASFAFSDASFQWGEWDDSGNPRTFADASGNYVIQYSGAVSGEGRIRVYRAP